MNFVNVKNDIAFRKIFGNEKKTEILISFLNAIMRLEGENRINAISIINPFQLPILPNMKASIIDVKATDFRGNTFIVEMQVANVSGMDKRLLYHTSKEYSQQIVSADKYTELSPVIFIGIFNFDFTVGSEYLSHHAICNVETKERVIKDMNFYFIELEKFKSKIEDLKTITEKWIYFIKEAENLDIIPDNLNDDGLIGAYQYANRNTWSLAELDAYNYMAMREQDERGRVTFALDKADKLVKEAEKKVDEAEKKVDEAEKKALIEKAVAVIALYKNDVPIPLIANSFKITVEEVEEIIKNR